MKHLDDEEMILWHYGESGDDTHPMEDARAHLLECRECGARYASLVSVLDAVEAVAVPERGPEYPAQVWKKIGRDVSASRWVRWPRTAPWNWAAATAAAAALLVAGFVAGRYSLSAPPAEPLLTTNALLTSMPADAGAGKRVLRLAVADHLERSQMVLVELANSNPKFNRSGHLNILSEQERAEALVSENRLYRQSAQFAGQTAVAGVLEELERVLLDITHGPSEISARELDALRQRLESEGILFKIHVLRSNVRMEQPVVMERL
jgi:hypothetical protein